MAKSSSHSKKRAKISSKDRTKKRSKSKRKSRKYRSKKLRRRDDSLSYSDDSDSRSLESVSSFSSEDDSRSRKARSRTRKDVRGSKKKVRRRSSSRDSIEDSPRGKKKQAQKKKNDYEGRKKTHSRKKPRRNASISCSSNTSVSCSTCPSGIISDDEIESRRHRGRHGKRNRDGSDINKIESGSKRARYRSRSCSSHSQRSESGDYQSEEKVTFENNTRRLRSVITVPEEDKNSRWVDKDGQKEEIAYDDDYPSCRSNDSNDGGGKGDLDNHVHVAFEKRMGVESGKEEEALVSEKDFGGQDDGKSSHDGIGIVGSVNESKNEVSGETSSLPGEDLESILRRRALENLKRFKGSPHQRIPAATANQEDRSDSDFKHSSTAKAELVQIESAKEGSSGGVVTMSSKKDADEMVATQQGEEANWPSYQVAVNNSNKKVNTSHKPNLASQTLRPHLLKARSMLRQAAASQEPPPERLLVTENIVDENASGTAQTVPQSINPKGEDINNGTGSAAPEPSGENVSDKQQGEAKDGSQFEKKTMSVMRGSEMVQVSYKVYIPKKAPNLARRKLNR